MTCTYRRASGLLLLYISFWGVTSSVGRSAIPGQGPETRLPSDCSDTSELQGVDISYLQLRVRLDFSMCCLTRAPGLRARECVSICSECGLCVCLCSLCLISVKKLGHNVCKGACSNYGQLCSLNALPYCTLPPHQPDITTHPPMHTQVICRRQNVAHTAPL